MTVRQSKATVVAALIMTLLAVASLQAQVDLGSIELPAGFEVSLYSDRVPGARSLRLGENGKEWGRPVDVLELPDGSLLVSDDKAGAVYRISYPGR